jgi:hypothetical protein
MKFTKIVQFILGYSQYLQLLIIAAFLYLLTWLLVNYIAPETVADWFWPDSYLPFQILLGLGNFFGFTFITQSRRFGLWAAIVIATILFFKLAHFVITLPLGLGLIFWSIALLILLWKPLNRSPQLTQPVDAGEGVCK